MATWSDECKGDDRQRLLVTADSLIATLEDVRHDSLFWHIRGDLAQLQDNVEHMRRVVARQPAGGRGLWVIAVSACVWSTVDAFSGLPDNLVV